jgi:hypothetical protein
VPQWCATFRGPLCNYDIFFSSRVVRRAADWRKNVSDIHCVNPCALAAPVECTQKVIDQIRARKPFSILDCFSLVFFSTRISSVIYQDNIPISIEINVIDEHCSTDKTLNMLKSVKTNRAAFIFTAHYVVSG